MKKSYAIVCLRKDLEEKDSLRLFEHKRHARLALALLDEKELINSGTVTVHSNLNNKVVASVRKNGTWFYIIEVEPAIIYDMV